MLRDRELEGQQWVGVEDRRGRRKWVVCDETPAIHARPLLLDILIGTAQHRQLWRDALSDEQGSLAQEGCIERHVGRHLSVTAPCCWLQLTAWTRPKERRCKMSR